MSSPLEGFELNLYIIKFNRIGPQDDVSNGFVGLPMGALFYLEEQKMEILLKDQYESLVRLERTFLSTETTQSLLEQLKSVEWSNHSIFIFGKWVKEPRSVLFMGDEGVSYTYSNQQMRAKAWIPQLLEIKNELNKKFLTNFNSVLINNYKNGEQYMGWHCDNEKELGVKPSICSLSIGATRDFILRNKADHSQKIKIDLKNGDLLIMQGQTQTYWDHSLPKRLKIKDRRINFTFREIL
jgi:alkylated DNA repair dioxygenase AlkB